jgi:hypothetical protein
MRSKPKTALSEMMCGKWGGGVMIALGALRRKHLSIAAEIHSVVKGMWVTQMTRTHPHGKGDSD